MSKSRSTGTAAETAVVRYLQNWWPAAERRALSGNKDRGDVAGIPQVCVEVKAGAQQRLAEWQRETLEERANAGARACMLVVKRAYKPVSRWDAWMPVDSIGRSLRGALRDGGDCEWVRLDLALAAAVLRSQAY